MKRMFIIGKDTFLVTTMRMALKYSSEVATFGVRDAGSGVRRALREASPDIVVLDGSDPAARTLERLAMIAEDRPSAIVIILAAAMETEVLEQALASGATVCLSRSLTTTQFDLLLSSHADTDGVAEAEPLTVPLPAGAPAPVQAGPKPATPSTPLTNREMEILRWVAEGHTNARIGRELWVTEQTVKFHLSNIFRKLGVSNRTEASRYVLLSGAAQSAPTVPLATVTTLSVVEDRSHHEHRFGAAESVR